MKKILCNTLIIIIMLGVFCNGCFDFSGLSFSDKFSYAEADNWSSCDSSDLVTAFRYYCKSRNLVVDSSVADALTSFTTTSFNNICSTLGIDPTTLQAELKKTTEGNLGLRFLFSQTGITAYNRIFAEFLQNNDLSVGDSVDNEVVYSAKTFTDADGNSCLVYVINAYRSENLPASAIQQWGTSYKYLNSDLVSMVGGYANVEQTASVSFHLLENYTYNNTIKKFTWTQGIYGRLNSNSIQFIKSVGNYHTPFKYASYVIWIDTYDGNKLKFGGFAEHYSDGNPATLNGYDIKSYYDLTGKGTANDTDVTVNTPNNTVINNNTYNNNTYVIIYQDGDTYISDDDDEPLPTTPPSGGGGGGGSDDPVNPDPDDPLDPYDPTKPFPDTPDNPTSNPGVHGSPGSDGTITIPDFNFDIPDIDWSLDGLQHKFPFSLPFDLYNACKLLNAEPQTPELDYTVDLVVYQWPIQMDLHWLDPAARIIRIFELLAFVVGLILITRHLIGG